ncbi:pectinesterase A [Vibrio cholerae]
MTQYHAIVDGAGGADFTSIQAAIEAAPENDAPYRIFIRKGHYPERLTIARANVSLVGECARETVIDSKIANQMVLDDGSIGGTYGSRVVIVDNQHCTLAHLTIRNSFDFIANQAKNDSDPSKLTHTQSVALLVGQHADYFIGHDLILDSYHDTLYVSAGRSYFSTCHILGSIDFIFGGGSALFEQCQITCRARSDWPKDALWGYIAAPSTPHCVPLGLVFYRCVIDAEADVPKGSYALGRPWHPTTHFSDGHYADPNAIGHCVYLECELGEHVSDWTSMSGRGRDGKRVWFTPEQSRFELVGNRGEGAHALPQQQREIDEHSELGWKPQQPFS